MLFDKKSKKRDLRIFRIPGDAPQGNKIPTRLAMGLLAPFVVVAIFLLIFSKKINLTSSVLKPGIPPAIEPAPPQAAPKPVDSPAPVVRTVQEAPLPKPPQKSSPPPSGRKKPEHVPSAGAAAPLKKIDQKLTFFKTLQDKPVIGKATVPAVAVTQKKLQNKQKIEKGATTPTVATITARVVTPAVVTTTASSTPATAAPLTPAIGRFTIQVGSFSKKEDADKLALKLKESGQTAYVVTANIPNKGAWYRVRVGHYQDRSSALDAANKLSHEEQISFIITSDTQ